MCLCSRSGTRIFTIHTFKPMYHVQWNNFYASQGLALRNELLSKIKHGARQRAWCSAIGACFWHFMLLWGHSISGTCSRQPFHEAALKVIRFFFVRKMYWLQRQSDRWLRELVSSLRWNYLFSRSVLPVPCSCVVNLTAGSRVSGSGKLIES